jgi:hypothetical protein
MCTGWSPRKTSWSARDRTVGNANHGAAPAWSPDGRTIAHQTRCGIRLVTPSGRAVYSSHLIRRTKGLGGGQERQKSPLARLSMEHDDGVRRLAGTPIVASDPLVAICSSVHVQSSGARSDQGRATCGVCC